MHTYCFGIDSDKIYCSKICFMWSFQVLDIKAPPAHLLRVTTTWLLPKEVRWYNLLSISPTLVPKCPKLIYKFGGLVSYRLSRKYTSSHNYWHFSSPNGNFMSSTSTCILDLYFIHNIMYKTTILPMTRCTVVDSYCKI